MNMLHLDDYRSSIGGQYTTKDEPVTENLHSIEFSEFLHTIIDSWRLILAVLIGLLLLGFSYILFVEPVYRADVMLQVETKPKGVGALAELSNILQDEAPVSAEFEILRSRMVLGTVVDSLKLPIIARPQRFPLLGGIIVRQHDDQTELASAWFGLERFAWGGERIKVETFDVPNALQGEEFILVAQGEGKYKLLSPGGKMILSGVVGKTTYSKANGIGKVRIFVSELKSNAGTRFRLVKNARLATIEKLKALLSITELGKQSGILQLSLEGTDRNQITTILNAIANIYLRQSVERKSAEAEKTLLFLEEQLPVLKDKMENAEAALNNFRLKKGSVDLPLETQATLEKIVTIEAELTQLRKSREELIRRFTPQHPRIAALDAQINNMNKELERVDVKVKGLPNTQQKILRLTRDAQVSTSLYTSLMNSSQELKIVKAGAVGNVRIVDYAVLPHEPVKPNKGLVVALTMILGLLLGVAAAFLRKSLLGAVQDPDLIEKKLGLPVYATIPRSRAQRDLDKNNEDSTKPAILAIRDPKDVAIESLRSLRTSLHFAQLNAKNNIISITSPGPGVGKSFISVNLATVLAGSDKRTLIVDADLRKGRVHEFFAKRRDGGLSELIMGDMPFEHTLLGSTVKNLQILTAGTVPPNPSELLLHSRFEDALTFFSENFDYVIIDSPPILAVTDAAIIGRLTGATLLVVKDNESPLREIEQSIKRLRQTGVNLCGAVFNGISSASGRYGYGKYYGYAYEKKYK